VRALVEGSLECSGLLGVHHPLSHLPPTPNPQPPPRHTRSVAARAEDVAGDLLESIEAVDSPRKYFDAMPTRSISGAQNAEFVKFSSGALARANAKLNEFFSLMPREAMAAARQTVAAQSSAVDDAE